MLLWQSQVLSVNLTSSNQEKLYYFDFFVRWQGQNRGYTSLIDILM